MLKLSLTLNFESLTFNLVFEYFDYIHMLFKILMINLHKT